MTKRTGNVGRPRAAYSGCQKPKAPAHREPSVAQVALGDASLLPSEDFGLQPADGSGGQADGLREGAPRHQFVNRGSGQSRCALNVGAPQHSSDHFRTFQCPAGLSWNGAEHHRMGARRVDGNKTRFIFPLRGGGWSQLRPKAEDFSEHRVHRCVRPTAAICPDGSYCLSWPLYSRDDSSIRRPRCRSLIGLSAAPRVCRLPLPSSSFLTRSTSRTNLAALELPPVHQNPLPECFLGLPRRRRPALSSRRYRAGPHRGLDPPVSTLSRRARAMSAPLGPAPCSSCSINFDHLIR